LTSIFLEFHFVRRFIVYLLSRFYRVRCYYSYFIFWDE